MNTVYIFTITMLLSFHTIENSMVQHYDRVPSFYPPIIGNSIYAHQVYQDKAHEMDSAAGLPAPFLSQPYNLNLARVDSVALDSLIYCP